MDPASDHGHDLCHSLPMTESNFLEVEESVDSSEGPSSIWAFPLGQGFKNQEVKADYPEESKLVITVPKDPDFQPAEDATDQTPEPHELVAAELPESEDQDQVQVVPVQVLEPIQAEVPRRRIPTASS